MIKTPLSTVLGGAGIWTPGCTVLGGQQNIHQLIKSLFANNEQGFTRTLDDLTILYQDAAGTIPVTGAEQPVGLMLDKSKGLALGIELFTGFVALPNTTISSPKPTTVVTSTAASGNYGARQSNIVQANKTYKVEFDFINPQGTRIGINLGSYYGDTQIGTSGKYKGIITTTSAGQLLLYSVSTAIGQTFTISNVSVKELAGNHAYQTQSAMRPLLAASPQRLDYDTVDDKLTTTLPAQLTGCTVVRAVPNVGTQILTNQTIPTTYNDNTDHCGLIVINRALTTTETAQITRLFNKAAGV